METNFGKEPELTEPIGLLNRARNICRGFVLERIAAIANDFPAEDTTSCRGLTVRSGQGGKEVEMWLPDDDEQSQRVSVRQVSQLAKVNLIYHEKYGHFLGITASLSDFEDKGLVDVRTYSGGKSGLKNSQPQHGGLGLFEVWHIMRMAREKLEAAKNVKQSTS